MSSKNNFIIATFKIPCILDDFKSKEHIIFKELTIKFKNRNILENHDKDDFEKLKDQINDALQFKYEKNYIVDGEIEVTDIITDNNEFDLEILE